MQRLLKVNLATHRGLGNRCDLSLPPRLSGKHLDDLALNQGRVNIEHDETFGPPRKARSFDGHVDLMITGHPNQRLAQCRVGER